MAGFPTPHVVTHGSTSAGAPLVVLLHGRGSDAVEMLSLAQHLPAGPAYAAVRAPIAEGGGYAWFANRGIGRPVAESLRETMDWFRTWLDSVAPAGRPVVLVGFSGGAAFAGGLVLDDPARYAGAAILYGTLPFDAGVPVEAGRLANLPVMVAQGEADHVIPRELLDRTWSWLLGESGAPVDAHRDAGGHGLTQGALRRLQEFVGHRLAHVLQHGAATIGLPGDVSWPGLPGGTLPRRHGDRPQVSWSIPQQQETQNAPVELQERLLRDLVELEGVDVQPSLISVPGARGLVVTPGEDADPQAFLVPTAGEFAHLHPAYDGSLHLALPPALAADLVAHGWGRPHPWAGSRLSAGFVMVFGPRDEEELAVVRAVVATSHAHARGGLTVAS